MRNHYRRILLALTLVLILGASVVVAESSIAGAWVGVSTEIGSVYRLQLDEGGGGTLHYVSRVGGEPSLRSYQVHDWAQNSARLTLELESLDGAPTLRLRGKLSGKQLALEIVRRKGARPEPLRLSREDRFLADFNLIREASVDDLP